MPEKEYKCAYSHCLHHDQKVNESEAVVLGKRHYHRDCASTKQAIQNVAMDYIKSTGNEKQFPMVMRILNTLVFKNEVPIEFIEKVVKQSRLYYADKPPQALYGLRRLFWEEEFKI